MSIVVRSPSWRAARSWLSLAAVLALVFAALAGPAVVSASDDHDGSTRLVDLAVSVQTSDPTSATVFSAVWINRQGSDPDYVRVTIDGAAFDLTPTSDAPIKDGRPYAYASVLDPGDHHIVFSAGGRDRFQTEVDWGTITVGGPAEPGIGDSGDGTGPGDPGSGAGSTGGTGDTSGGGGTGGTDTGGSGDAAGSGGTGSASGDSSGSGTGSGDTAGQGGSGDAAGSGSSGDGSGGAGSGDAGSGQGGSGDAGSGAGSGSGGADQGSGGTGSGDAAGQGGSGDAAGSGSSGDGSGGTGSGDAGSGAGDGTGSGSGGTGSGSSGDGSGGAGSGSGGAGQGSSGTGSGSAGSGSGASSGSTGEAVEGTSTSGGGHRSRSTRSGHTGAAPANGSGGDTAPDARPAGWAGPEDPAASAPIGAVAGPGDAGVGPTQPPGSNDGPSTGAGTTGAGTGPGGGAEAAPDGLSLLGLGQGFAERTFTAVPVAMTTTGVVVVWAAFVMFGKKRRDDEPPAPDAVLSLHAATTFEAPVSALVPPPLPPGVDPSEAGMPRWRRPSLLEARKNDPLRSATMAVSLTFAQGAVAAVAGKERRRIRYRLVRLMDVPDELRANEIGILDEGDEIQILETSGVYRLVLCPDGSQGWLHKMVLGDVVDDEEDGPSELVPDGIDEDVLSAYLAHCQKTA